MIFQEVEKYIIPMTDFSLKWRFTEEEHSLLPEQHIKELKPLNNTGAKVLNNYIIDSGVHNQLPFKTDFFRNLDNTKIINGNEKEVTKWLYRRALPFDQKVYLSWDDQIGMITKWKFVVKYWNSLFYGGGSDDLTVFDQSLEWALLFFHEDEIYFGTNKKYYIEKKFNNKVL